MMTNMLERSSFSQAISQLKWRTVLPRFKHSYRKRAVVSFHLKERVMTEVHSRRLSGHFSGTHLYNVLARVWWWEGMYKDAVKHSKSCPDCAIAVGGGRPGRPPLQPIPVQGVFHIV